jgi:hypothetical protein
MHMKVSKLLFALSMVFFCRLQASQPHFHATIKGLFGGLEDVMVNTHITRDSFFLYSLWHKTGGDEKAFLDAVINNRQGKSLDECTDILEKNEQVLSEAHKKIDKDFYAAIQLSEGLKSGAMFLGGLFGLYKSTQMIKDMYWRKRFAREEVEDLLLAKIESMQPGYLKPDASVGGKERIEYLKTVKIPESFGEEESDKIDQKYNLISARGFNEYIGLYAGATVLSTTSYLFGANRLENYLRSVYRLYQRKKLEYEQLMFKDKIQNKRMLEILRPARGFAARLTM